ncbi:ABC transporter permease [Nitriliruptoraceae bacterium ZYF776]|nr:ABC transporter permease [Profundirhabdus halotolerans]
MTVDSLGRPRPSRDAAAGHPGPRAPTRARAPSSTSRPRLPVLRRGCPVAHHPRPDAGSPRLVRLGEPDSLPDYLRSLWQRREFAWHTARGELQSQHLDTVLGNLWHLINPILLISVYYLVFGLILGSDRGLPEGLFLPFLAVGVFTFQFSQKAVIGGARTISSNQGLIRTLQFPRALLPISTVLRETMGYATAFIVMFGVVLLRDPLPRWMWLLVPVAFGLQLMFTLGLTFVSARLTDRYRDLENLLPFLFRLMFYASGVLFRIDAYLDDPLVARLFLLNPFYVFVTLPRHLFFREYNPPNTDWMWVSAGLWAVVALVVGLLVFRAGEREYGRG